MKRFALAALLGGVILTALFLLARWQPLAAGCALGVTLLGILAGRLIYRPADEPASSSVPPAPPPPSAEVNLAEVLASNALLETVMESMRDVLLALDRNCYVVASNRAARTLFGQTEEAMTHRRLTELTRNPAVINAFQEAITNGTRGEAKVELTQGAERRIFALRVSPLRLRRQSRRQQGAVGVFFDITELERLEKVRQEFLSNVSHELRTPLTSILAFVETLEDGALDDAQNNRRFLGIIRRNAERMRLLMEDILELSAIEAGKINLTRQPVRLASVIENIFAALTARAAERQVTLYNEVPADTEVYADARRLEQMLTNLIDNAIKFNRAGGAVRVTHTMDNEHARICVTDTGEGIAPEHLSRLFERFYRVDRARSREMGGTGLGLAIVKHLARVHGGETTVCSTLGQGTTFTVALPRH